MDAIFAGNDSAVADAAVVFNDDGGFAVEIVVDDVQPDVFEQPYRIPKTDPGRMLAAYLTG